MIEDVEVLFDDSEPFESVDFFRITSDDGNTFTITNEMVSKDSASRVIDRYGYGYEGDCFWFFYDVASFQAGRLMIYDVKKKELNFDYFDEAFCITSLGYNISSDSFLGVVSYHLPMTPKTFPDRYFFIGRDRRLVWDPVIPGRSNSE